MFKNSLKNAQFKIIYKILPFFYEEFFGPFIMNFRIYKWEFLTKFSQTTKFKTCTLWCEIAVNLVHSYLKMTSVYESNLEENIFSGWTIFAILTNLNYEQKKNGYKMPKKYIFPL